MKKHLLLLALMASTGFAAQMDDCKTAILKHLRTSEDFTLKVANAMPDADYTFKLTPAQMSFGEQMNHLASALTHYAGPFTKSKIAYTKPDPSSKSAVIAYVKQCYEAAISVVSQTNPDQLSQTYKAGGGSKTGVDILLGMLDHATNHRASAEMYLRVKGITPPEYEN